MILTGSRALSYYLGEDLYKVDSDGDIDLICSEKELNKLGLSFNGSDSVRYQKFEFINEESLNNNKINGDSTKRYWIIDKGLIQFSICTLEELYAQKRSHIWRSKKFARDMIAMQKIINLLKQNNKFPLQNKSQDILDERIKLTKKMFGDRVPSLNKSNKDFFNDNVVKHFEHDDIHLIMAHYDRPLYERLKHQDKVDLAFCSKDLWNKLSYEDKVKCVQEECYVIAVERYVIPRYMNGDRFPPEKITFYLALERVCTTLTSGYFRDFAIDNWEEIVKFKSGFYDKLFNAINKSELNEFAKTY